MRKLNRLTMTLALLIMAVGGAWAQSTLNVVELKVPANWATDESLVTATDLPGFKASTVAEAQAWTGAPKTGYALLFYAIDGEYADFVSFENGVAGQEAQTILRKNDIFGSKSDYKIYYTASDAIELTPDETGKSWTLAKMPASNVELQVEYFAESNLFLSKDALADKGSIAVKAGDLGVQFGEDGKSANPVTEGTPMTVTYNGTKKLLGVKVEKKVPLLSIQIGGVVTATIYYVEGETWAQAIQNHPTENSAWGIDQGYVSSQELLLFKGDDFVNSTDTIDPKANYYFQWM